MTHPYEVEKVPGSSALDALESLASAGRGYPVLLGPNEEALEYFTATSHGIRTMIEAAAALDTDAWLTERVASDPEYYAEDRGPWPDDAVTSSISAHLTVEHEPYARVSIVLVPAAEPWQAPCYLSFGGWNDCPFPSEHAAMFKRWEERYGATVAAITHDTVEMRVARPPRSRDEALVLAREQFVYCADIVHQGTDTLDALAASLLSADCWFFWWD